MVSVRGRRRGVLWCCLVLVGSFFALSPAQAAPPVEPWLRTGTLDNQLDVLVVSGPGQAKETWLSKGKATGVAHDAAKIWTKETGRKVTFSKPNVQWARLDQATCADRDAVLAQAYARFGTSAEVYQSQARDLAVLFDQPTCPVLGDDTTRGEAVGTPSEPRLGSGGVVLLPFTQAKADKSTVHAMARLLGLTYGLGAADAYTCDDAGGKVRSSDARAYDPERCRVTALGDTWSIMGEPSAKDPHLTAAQRHWLGLLPDSGVVTVSEPGTTEVALRNVDEKKGVRAVVVADGPAFAAPTDTELAQYSVVVERRDDASKIGPGAKDGVYVSVADLDPTRSVTSTLAQPSGATGGKWWRLDKGETYVSATGLVKVTVLKDACGTATVRVVRTAPPPVVVTESSDAFTITGTGFAAGEQVTATVYSAPVALGTALADTAGAVMFTVAKDDLAPGWHHAVLMGATAGQGTASFYVPEPDPGGNGNGGNGGDALKMAVLEWNIAGSSTHKGEDDIGGRFAREVIVYQKTAARQGADGIVAFGVEMCRSQFDRAFDDLKNEWEVKKQHENADGPGEGYAWARFAPIDGTQCYGDEFGTAIFSDRRIPASGAGVEATQVSLDTFTALYPGGQVWKLTRDGDTDNRLMCVKLDTVRISACVVHIVPGEDTDDRRRVQAVQLRQVRDRVQGYEPGAFVLAGDLNVVPGSEPLKGWYSGDSYTDLYLPADQDRERVGFMRELDGADRYPDRCPVWSEDRKGTAPDGEGARFDWETCTFPNVWKKFDYVFVRDTTLVEPITEQSMESAWMICPSGVTLHSYADIEERGQKEDNQLTKRFDGRACSDHTLLRGTVTLRVPQPR